MLLRLLVVFVFAATMAACSRSGEAPPPPAATGVPAPAAAPGPAQGGPTANLPPDHTTAEQAAATAKAASDAGLPVTPQTRTTFKCDNDETIEVRFFPEQGVAVLVRNGQNAELQQQPVASGFGYSDGQTTLRGKGSELKLDAGTAPTLTCRAD